MATFTYIPDFSATENSAPSVRMTKFGDGYEHRVRFGLHTDLKQWDLTFANRSDSEAAGITGFFTARAGVESFTWTPPTTGANAAQFVCEQWQVTMDAYNLNTVRARFREVAEP